MITIDEKRTAKLAHIKQSVLNHQMPDLAQLKSLHDENVQLIQQRLNALREEQNKALRKAEEHARQMYQRHHYASSSQHSVGRGKEPKLTTFN